METQIKLLLIIVLSFTVNAKEISVVSGQTLRPYVNSETTSGIEIEIFQAAMKKNSPIKFYFIPYKRILSYLKSSTYDAALTVSENHVNGELYLSDSHIQYHNTVVTLKNNKFKISSLKDLKHKNVIAFQNASIVLGDRYRSSSNEFLSYREMANQRGQVALLLKGSTDAIVIDKKIFYYYLKNLNLNNSPEYEFHDIFPISKYSVAFKQIKLRDQFNKGLKTIKKNGTYDQIIKKYISK